MKSEERRHLAENDLELTLQRWLDRIEPYSSRLMGGVLLLTVLAVGGILWYRMSQASDSAGWGQLATARTPENLLDVATNFPDTRAAQWAELRAGRILYDRAVTESMSNRAAADDDFSEAKDIFGRLVKQKLPPELREASLDGLARTLEATSKGDTAEAIEAYETLVREFPESIFRTYAEHRIEVLKQPETQEFYAWFSKQNPTPPDRPEPKDGAAAGGLNAPELPAMDMKAAPAEGTSASGEEAPKTTSPFLAPLTGEETTPVIPGATPAATETPAEPGAATPPATEEAKPATEAPATETPATEPPAAEAPATETPATDASTKEPATTEPPTVEAPPTDSKPESEPAPPETSN
jgi:hypothetical protein